MYSITNMHHIPLYLRGKTSKRARDLHLLKTLKSHLRNNSEEEVLKTVSEIKTSGVRKQAVQALIQSQHLTSSLLQGLLDIFLPVYCPGVGEDKGASGFSSSIGQVVRL